MSLRGPSLSFLGPPLSFLHCFECFCSLSCLEGPNPPKMDPPRYRDFPDVEVSFEEASHHHSLHTVTMKQVSLYPALILSNFSRNRTANSVPYTLEVVFDVSAPSPIRSFSFDLHPSHRSLYSFFRFAFFFTGNFLIRSACVSVGRRRVFGTTRKKMMRTYLKIASLILG